MDKAAAIVATLGAGALVALQPPANSLLSNHVGALGAAFLSSLVSATLLIVLVIATGAAGDLGSGISGFRPVHLWGGIAGAAIVAVSLVTVKQLGAGGVVAATICTQLGMSVVLDHFGALGLERQAVTPLKVLGILLLAGGTLAVTAGR